MKFIAAKKAAESAPKVLLWVLALVVSMVLVVVGSIATLTSTATHAASPTGAAIANLEGWSHPLGGPTPWLTYYGYHHNLGAVDFQVPTGAPIYSVADGVVTYAAPFAEYGLAVIVDHPSGDTSLYAHLSLIQVTAGQQLSSGQQIGLSGSTGFSSGPHLHFELRVGSSRLDAIGPSVTVMADRGIEMGPCEAGPCYLAY